MYFIKSTIICFLISYISASRKVSLLLMGQIGSGRSSLVNQFIQSQVAPVGNDDGEKTTIKNSYYEHNEDDTSYLLIDSVGLEGNYFKDIITSFDIIQDVKIHLEENDYKELTAILFLLSYENYSSFATDIQILKSILGNDIVKNIIVVPSKLNVKYEKKIQRILEHEKFAGHFDFNLADTKDFTSLRKTLDQIIPIKLEEITQTTCDIVSTAWKLKFQKENKCSYPIELIQSLLYVIRSKSEDDCIECNVNQNYMIYLAYVMLLVPIGLFGLFVKKKWIYSRNIVTPPGKNRN